MARVAVGNLRFDGDDGGLLMSIPAINWCIEQRDLPPGEWVVLFHLSHCHNHETGRCDPSQDYLSGMTNMGLRTVQRHLTNLQDKGRIFRQKRGIEGGGRLSDYYVLGHEPAKLAEYLTRHLMRTNPPSDAEKMHEMAGKQEETGIKQELIEEAPQNPEPVPKKKDDPPEVVPLPEGWVPNDADFEYALSKKLTREEIEEIADDFHDYWRDQPKTKRSARGWASVWRGNVRRVANQFIRNRGMAGNQGSRGYGQGGSIASAVARRRAGSEV